MKKSWLLFVLLLSMTAMSACQRSKMVSDIAATKDSGETLEVKNIHYQKDGIDAYYPQIISGASEEKIAIWNKIIEDDFNKILKIYAFNPFPELPSPTTAPPTILTITNEIKSKEGRYFSVFYKANYNSPFSAHPTELVYTTNIDRIENKRVRLPDLVKVDEDFVKDFRTWEMIPFEKENAELNKAIQDYLNGLSDEDLLHGFLTADIIGSDNPWGTFSYITDHRLGISLSVPTYLGDHVEFEKNVPQKTELSKNADN